MTLPDDLVDRMVLRPMVRAELDALVAWAAAEGWNPGIDDADVFWATDPNGFVAAEVDGELVGGGSIVAYGTTYGFMGFFLVRPDLRQQGLGRPLWLERKRLLLDRLGPGAPIEMDGVFHMQDFYAEGGFVEHHRDLRFEGVATATDVSPRVVDLADVPFAAVDDYDRRHFPAPRTEFVRRWIVRPGGHALGVVVDGVVRGYAVSRPCVVGHRIGPLFADGPDVAEELLAALATRLVGETVFLDVPECNAHAMSMVRRRGMVEVFGCGRMTFGTAPPVPWDEIFAVTTLELG